VIVATSLNSAVDVTYTVAALVLGESHRVSSVRSRAGGKGINVARVLRQLGEEVVVAGLCGGRTGAVITDDLATSGSARCLTPLASESRRTVTVVGRAHRDGVQRAGPHRQRRRLVGVHGGVRPAGSECRRVVGAMRPFIFLSGGVSAELFRDTLRFAHRASSSFTGVLCGRATWRGAPEAFVALGASASEYWLCTTGRDNIQALSEVLATTASPSRLAADA
jgi:hypothetical protein